MAVRMDTGEPSMLGWWLPMKKETKVWSLADYTKSVRKITRKVHEEAASGKKRPQEPLEKVKIGKAAPWIVQNAKDVGIDIDGYEHEVSNYFIRHVIKNHGDEKTEKNRGNLPVLDDDFERIPTIIESPDYTIFGAKRSNENRIIYIKSLDSGTMLYFEEILTGERNKSLRGNTMYKTMKRLDKKGILANIGMNGKTDLSNIKITGTGGSQTTNTANKN
jgi:hypothetical protein